MAREPVEARQTAILEATCRVLIERGFAALRIQDVAQQLGVSTGLIHYHFDSKEQLLEAALRLAGQADLDQLRADVAEARGPVAKLDAYFQAYCPKGAEPGWLVWIDAWGESLRRPELRRISQEFDEASVQVVRGRHRPRGRRRHLHLARQARVGMAHLRVGRRSRRADVRPRRGGRRHHHARVGEVGGGLRARFRREAVHPSPRQPRGLTEPRSWYPDPPVSFGPRTTDHDIKGM